MATHPYTTSTTPHNLLASMNLLKVGFDLIYLKTFYRRNHLQRKVRHRVLHLSKVCRPVVKSGLNSSCTSSECQGCVGRPLLGLRSCTHVSKDTLTRCTKHFLLEQLLISLTERQWDTLPKAILHFPVLSYKGNTHISW